MSRSLYYLETENESQDIKDTLLMIMGTCPIHFINVDNMNDAIQAEDEKIIFTSGLLSNEIISQDIKSISNICFISGFNLFMLLDAILGIDADHSFDTYVRNIVKNGQASINIVEREDIK